MKEVLIDTCEFDFLVDKEKPANETWCYFERFDRLNNKRETVTRIDFDKVEKHPNKFGGGLFYGFDLYKNNEFLQWIPPHKFAFMFAIEE